MVPQPGPPFRVLAGRCQDEPLEARHPTPPLPTHPTDAAVTAQELDDPPATRATRAARRDPLRSPSEPAPLRLRAFHAAPGADGPCSGEVRLIVRRELDTVADALAQLAQALRADGEAHTPPLRLVLGGKLLPPGALLWDAGWRPGKLVYFRGGPT